MRYLLCILLLCGFGSVATAQITLTSTDFLLSGAWNATTYSNSTDLTGVPSLIAQSGADQTWTYPSIAFAPQSSGFTNAQVVSYSTSLPMATDADFTTATDVVTGTSADFGGAPIYEYLRVTNDGVWLLGVVVGSGSQAAKILDYSVPDQVMKLPLTYQTSWTSTFDQSSAFDPGSVTHTSKAMVADAWGTLVVPPTPGFTGTSFPAIRVKMTTTEITTVQGVSDTSISYTYEWYTKSGVSATIYASSDQTPNSIEYSVPGAAASVQMSSDDALSVQFSQNPASNRTRITFSLPQSTDVTIQMMDMLGANVRTYPSLRANTGSNSIAIDASDLAKGTYFVRISTDNISEIRKLVIAK